MMLMLASGWPGAPPTSRNDRALLSDNSPGCARRPSESFLPILTLAVVAKLGKHLIINLRFLFLFRR